MTQFWQTLLAEQLTQLVRLQETQRLPSAEGARPRSQASQTLLVLHWRQFSTLQEKQVLLVVLRVKFWAQVTQMLEPLVFLQMSQSVMRLLQG